MNDNMPETVKLAVSKFSRELKRMLGERLVRVVLYGSYARGTNDKDSDIDIVVDTKGLDIPTIEKLKNAFIPMKADVLITDLLKQEDTALDDLLISIGVGKNLDSVYKSIMREVIWVGEKS